MVVAAAAAAAAAAAVTTTPRPNTAPSAQASQVASTMSGAATAAVVAVPAAVSTATAAVPHGVWWQRRTDGSRVRLSGVGCDASRRDAAADRAAASFREHELNGGPKYPWQRADVIAAMRVRHDDARPQQRPHARKPEPVALEWSLGNTGALQVATAERARAEESW